MQTRFSHVGLLVCLGSLLVGCATLKPGVPFQPQALDLEQGRYVQKVDHFLVALDASLSMADHYAGKRKAELAKDTVTRMGGQLEGVKIGAGLRTFARNIIPGFDSTSLLYGMAPYSGTDMQKALDSITKVYGLSPLPAALRAAEKDLKDLSGNLAVIVISDGTYMDAAKVTAAAAALKKTYGDRLCIHAIQVGKDAGGKRVFDSLVQAGACGLAVNMDDLATDAAMEDWVKTVFFKDMAGGLADSDGDGVPDALDECPKTPPGVKVDEKGCPVDEDGDGVPDYKDKCPGTPKGAQVDAHGCWKPSAVLFDFDKWNVKEKFQGFLRQVAFILMQNRDMKARVEGHTDSVGPTSYNQGLSERRAKAVRSFLEQFGLESQRITVKGLGATKPVAPNDTQEGRAQNRRAEIVILP